MVLVVARQGALQREVNQMGNVQVELTWNGLGECEVTVFARSGRYDVNWTTLGVFGPSRSAAFDACKFAENTAAALGVECVYGNSSLEKVGRVLRPVVTVA